MLDPEEYIETISPVVIIALSASVVGEVVEQCRQAGMNKLYWQTVSADRFSGAELGTMALLRRTI